MTATASGLADELQATLTGDPEAAITDVTHDSRQVNAGSLFVAVRGLSTDGHDFVPAAIASGAAALCVEDSGDWKLPTLVVSSTRAALGPAASLVHGHPSRATSVVGVTGTNGKTTVTHMLASIVDASGASPGLIGTVGGRIGDRPIDLRRTTPEASDFQRLLAEMVEEGVAIVATEVSSHAMSLHRVDGTRFAAVAFTGLSQDHLDFHGDMQAYFSAKAGLFTEEFADLAVINVEDEFGRRLRDLTDLNVVSVGQDVTATDIELKPNASRFLLSTPIGTTRVELPMGGGFNVSNALTAAACAIGVGLDLDSIATGLAQLPVIAGRMEPIPDPAGRYVFVDYAHTPDGITQAVATAAQLTKGRIIAVVGAAGDRDKAKRPLMGEAAAAADLAVITSDNPRSEEPTEIIDEVVAGLPPDAAFVVQPDRRLAIRAALAEASADDIVLILGKGHETGQEFADGIVDFDDRVVTAEELDALGARS